MKELYDALEEDDLTKFKSLLKDASLSRAISNEGPDFKNKLFLHACGRRVEKIVQYLVEEESVDVNFLDSLNNTGLHLAVSNLFYTSRSYSSENHYPDKERRKANIVEFLLRQPEINIDQKNDFGYSPLWYSTFNLHDTNPHQKKVMMLLIKAGSSLEKPRKGHVDLLAFAIGYEFYELAELLVKEKNFDVNMIDDQGLSIISQSFLIENLDSFNFLIKHGAIIDKDVVDSLMETLRKNSFQKQYSSLLNIQDCLGQTFLHIAAGENMLAAAKKLLELKASPDILDKNGRTFLDVARERGHDDFVQAFATKNIKIEDHNDEIPLSTINSGNLPRKKPLSLT